MAGGRQEGTPPTVTGRAMVILGAFSEDRPVMGARLESALADPGRANTPVGDRFAAAVVSTTQTERPARRQTGPCVTALSVSDKP